MELVDLLEEGRFNQAIQTFTDMYKKVNCVLMIPIEDTYFTVQLPVTDGNDKDNICRYDFILTDTQTNKVLRHGFMQFPTRLISGYSYQGALLSFQVQPNLTLRFVGSE
jgi:hypothetical protein